MKLLLDQNISRKLVSELAGLFPNSCHLTSILPETSLDQEIWDVARDNGFVIVTKDDDFEQRSVLYGHPPKVVWVRLGNCRTKDILLLLRRAHSTIMAFGEDMEKSILPLP